MYNYKIYTALDFENIGCVSFRDEGMGPQSDLVSRSIVLTFNADSVANLGDIIAKLEERPDIYYIWASLFFLNHHNDYMDEKFEIYPMVFVEYLLSFQFHGNMDMFLYQFLLRHYIQNIFLKRYMRYLYVFH